MEPVAAIDVGSNAVRLAIGSFDREHKLTTVESFREPLRLGQDVFTTGTISEQSLERLVATLREFKQITERHGVSKVRAVATSACREAANRDLVVRRVRERAGMNLEIIQGIEEARLIARAVLSKVEMRRKLGLLIDIGGGSLEISLVNDGDVILSDSVKMGAVRLLQILEARKKSAKVFQRLVRDYAQGLRRQLKKELGTRKVSICVGTGGNLESLVDLKRSLLKQDDCSFVTRAEIDDLSEKLQDMSFKERVEKLDLREDRADVIIPAVIVIQAVLRHADVERLVVPRVSLKDGVMLELLDDGTPISNESYRRQVLAFSQELGRRFAIEEEHASKVQALATELFDRTASIHKLTPQHRILLEIASYLHDIGYAINIHDHHKHGAYILRSTPYVGISEREKAVIAAIVRYHRKGEPKPDHPDISVLDRNEREVVSKLAALVRLAEALDKGHTGAVSAIDATMRSGELSLKLHGKGEHLLERWALEQKKDFFEDVYNVKVSVAE